MNIFAGNNVNSCFRSAANCVYATAAVTDFTVTEWSFWKISEITNVSNFKIYRRVALDSLYVKPENTENMAPLYWLDIPQVDNSQSASKLAYSHAENQCAVAGPNTSQPAIMQPCIFRLTVDVSTLEWWTVVELWTSGEMNPGCDLANRAFWPPHSPGGLCWSLMLGYHHTASLLHSFTSITRSGNLGSNR